MENVKDELNETRDEKIDTKVSTAIRERVLKDINHHDRKKFEKASKILEKIEESESLSLDQTSRLMVNQSSTGILVADLLYDLQQITSKLSLKHYKVLSFLDISSQLTCNAYAKKFLAFSPNEKFNEIDSTVCYKLEIKSHIKGFNLFEFWYMKQLPSE